MRNVNQQQRREKSMYYANCGCEVEEGECYVL